MHNVYKTTHKQQTNMKVERLNFTILVALHTHIAVYPKDWDIYMDSLTYAYNCQQQTSTAVASFELVLWRPPPKLVTQSDYSEEQSQIYFKNKCKLGIKQTLANARKKLLEMQWMYKQNYENLLRLDVKIIKSNTT